MLKDKITCLIFSCDKFSDLWDGNLKLFRENWPERDFETYIVTDKPTDRTFPDVKIIAAGADMEWSDRLKYALEFVKTDYVFVTLDDYFLIKKVDNNRMEQLVDLLDVGRYDYLRLFPDPVRSAKEELPEYKGIHRIDNTYEYSVNLYQGIWNYKFLEYCVKTPKNAWHFEVELRDSAIQFNANCLVSFNDEYKVLDVVRKGKLLRNAARYFKKNPGIYNGNRPVNSWWYEFTLGIKDWGQRHTPECLLPVARKILSYLGFKFYSTQSA